MTPTDRPTHSVKDIGSWFLARGKVNDRPSIVRGRTELGALLRHPALATRFVVRWAYEDADSAGLPGTESIIQMEDFENTLTATLEQDCAGILTAVLTHHGTRLWVFYVADLDEVGRRLDDALPQDQPLPIRLTATADPAWDEYRAMIEQTGAAE